MMERLGSMGATLTVFILSLSVPLATPRAMAQKGMLDPADPAHMLKLSRKVACSTVENEPVVFRWHGAAYGR